ncbi:hypothetical protein [Limnohabitans sp. DM1]|uniref:hypothetical protein n=1 Tax=Limnohabitans sp. DM1 TaxID=1597955 RepID=UPI001E65AFC3|nr:hypothetical protein [Limnohabitans sp. DM1]
MLLKLLSQELAHGPLASLTLKAGGAGLPLKEDADLSGLVVQAEPLLSPEDYSVRGLADSTGVSKSEVANALKRCTDVGLLKTDRYTGCPVVNRAGLYEFLVHGIRYVFPARLGELTRGIPTAVGAPVLADKLMSAGDLVPVWSDAAGSCMGQSVEPLFKSVPMSVRRDPVLYDLLALTDALRVGKPREQALAAQMLADRMAVAA